VLLNFWATWCPPCVEETQSLNQLQRRITPLGGTVLGVSVDDDPQAYEIFLKTYHITSPPSATPQNKSPSPMAPVCTPTPTSSPAAAVSTAKSSAPRIGTAPHDRYINSLFERKVAAELLLASRRGAACCHKRNVRVLFIRKGASRHEPTSRRKENADGTAF